MNHFYAYGGRPSIRTLHAMFEDAGGKVRVESTSPKNPSEQKEKPLDPVGLFKETLGQLQELGKIGKLPKGITLVGEDTVEIRSDATISERLFIRGPLLGDYAITLEDGKLFVGEYAREKDGMGEASTKFAHNWYGARYSPNIRGDVVLTRELNLEPRQVSMLVETLSTKVQEAYALEQVKKGNDKRRVFNNMQKATSNI